MAKLSAHGAELLRTSLAKEVTDAERMVDWERISRSYHTDGWVLEKIDVHFKPGIGHVNGERHSYGWKRRCKVKPGLTPRQIADMAAGKGWTVEYVTSLSADSAIRTGA